MAPPKFKDLGKAARDILTKDYHGDRKLKVTTKTSNDVTFTTEGKMVNNSSVLGSLSAKFKHSSGIRINKLAVNTHGRVNGEIFMDDVVDGATVNVKFEDGNAGQNLGGKDYKQSGSVGIDYADNSMTVGANFDVVNGPTVNLNTVFAATDEILLGGNFKYNTGLDEDSGSADVEDYGVAVGYAGADFDAVLNAGKMFKQVDLSVLHRVDNDTTVAVQASYNTGSQTKGLTLGGSWALDNDTSFQAKVDSNANLSFNYIQQINSSVKLGASVSLDAKDFAADTHSFGLSLTLF